MIRMNLGFVVTVLLNIPDTTEFRHKTKLGIQKQETEPAITSIGPDVDVSIRLRPPLRGGFAQLAKKGTIRFTDYHTTEKQ
jgi:hypothetical protein